MTATEALAEIKRKAAGGQVRFTGHAIQRMRQRSATPRDVVSALVTATSASASDDGAPKYKVSGGVDLDGDDLDVVVVLEGDVLVVTLF